MVRTLGTLLQPSSGSATIVGIPLSPENGTEIRRRIAVMPDSPGLYLRLSVLENLECFADLYEVARPRERIDEALRAVGLAERVHDPCGSLSRGLSQRVALARALLSDPDILFLDEPTSGLDPVAAREVHELVGGLRGRGVTIFITTHRLEEAERLCDRVAILNTTLRTIGRPAELRARLFQTSLEVRTVATLPLPDGVFNGLPGVTGWEQAGPASTRWRYPIRRSPHRLSRERWSAPVRTCCRSPRRATPSRTSTSSSSTRTWRQQSDEPQPQARRGHRAKGDPGVSAESLAHRGDGHPAAGVRHPAADRRVRAPSVVVGRPCA
jgi:ABC-type Na+ transport system ATPase subunit NatA